MTLRSLTAWGLVGACLALSAGCGDEPSGDGPSEAHPGDDLQVRDTCGRS